MKLITLYYLSYLQVLKFQSRSQINVESCNSYSLSQHKTTNLAEEHDCNVNESQRCMYLILTQKNFDSVDDDVNSQFNQGVCLKFDEYQDQIDYDHSSLHIIRDNILSKQNVKEKQETYKIQMSNETDGGCQVENNWICLGNVDSSQLLPIHHYRWYKDMFVWFVIFMLPVTSLAIWYVMIMIFKKCFGRQSKRPKVNMPAVDDVMNLAEDIKLSYQKMLSDD